MIYHVTHRRRIAKKHANRFARMVRVRIRQARGHLRPLGLFDAVSGKRCDISKLFSFSVAVAWAES